MSGRLREMLEHSFLITKGEVDGISRLEFLSDFVFDFTTYDSGMGEVFASKALEACAAISDRKTFDYIKDQDNYRWFLLMVNMPFFVGRLEWGTSIRGAWWVHEDQTLESSGLWEGNEQALSMTFTRDAWADFVAALLEFAERR